MSSKLRDFIRSIRSCRTAAEERSTVAKECALIRTAFKEGDTTYRHRNVAKLLFIHMMGYPTHFGQMECLRLIASPKFAEKRIGYLGLNQFMDENADLLMLVTNSIKNDLHHPSQYVNGLGLTALGNIGSAEMCRTLAKEVESLCCSGNPYVRKKAILCAIRLVRKVEEIGERFIHIVPSIFEEKNHGVLLAACSFVCALAEADPSLNSKFIEKVTSQVIVCLKRVIVVSGYSATAEYDVSGITDPFLQVKLLQTLRVLQENAEETNDDLADIIAQLVSSMDSSKPSANAVLLECVTTIFGVKHDKSLRDLGANILGKFLQTRDNNIRYVALSCLRNLVKLDPSAMQPHRTMIIDCLRDPDPPIRRRALEVTYNLLNQTSIHSLLKELLGLLVSVSGDTTSQLEDKEFKVELISKICTAIERFAPTRRWQLDSLLRVFTLASDSVPLEVRNSFISLIIFTPELQQYATIKLLFAAKDNMSQTILLQVAIWTIGEFGHLLVDNKEGILQDKVLVVTPKEIMDFVELCARRTIPSSGVGGGGGGQLLLDSRAFLSKQSMAKNSSATSMIEPFRGFLIGVTSLMDTASTATFMGNNYIGFQELLINCLIKLSSRIPSELPRIKLLLNCYTTSLSIDVQQRACEYNELLKPFWDNTRAGILDHMPLFSEGLEQRSVLLHMLDRPIGDISLDELPPSHIAPQSQQNELSSMTKCRDLLDLEQFLDVSSQPATELLEIGLPASSLVSTTTQPHSLPEPTVEDLLANIFGTPNPPSTTSNITESSLYGKKGIDIGEFDAPSLL